MPKKLTSEVFIDKCNIAHNNFYDYSITIYKSLNDSIQIICPIHGEFKQNANDHKKGSGCHQCGINKIKSAKYNNTLQFINKSILLYGDKYDYSETEYKDRFTKVKIICKIHGLFEQSPTYHYRNNGCVKCQHEKTTITKIKNKSMSTKCWSYKDWKNKAEKSKTFDSYKCYIIKCWNENEEFYKIGKTFRKLNERFRFKKEMPYSWELLQLWVGEADYISKLEKKLQSENKHNNIIPLIKFGGSFECFKNLNENELFRL